MGIYVRLAAALIAGLTVAFVAALSSAHVLSPDNQVATVIDQHEATVPNVADYGSR